MHTLIKKIQYSEVCILVVKLGTLKEITPGGGGGGERGIGSSMASYIVNNNPQRARQVPPITFIEDDALSLHYSHCDALVIRWS